MSAALVWLRRDLRLADNPALRAAGESGLPIIVAYIHDTNALGQWRDGAASCWWLQQALTNLQAQLHAIGGELVLRTGDSEQQLLALCDEHQVEQVFWNRLYEPLLVERDREIQARLRERELAVQSFQASLLLEPWQLLNRIGEPYKVFTPFWKVARQQITADVPLAAPTKVSSVANVQSLQLAQLELLAKHPWHNKLNAHWDASEVGAHENLEIFLDDCVSSYTDGRNRPDRRGTSKLSPYLHFGQITPRQVLHAMRLSDIEQETYFTELGWREFAHYVLFHFPRTSTKPFNEKFEKFVWREPDEKTLRAWQCGNTGIPIVDAGMRELWQTGWMHNRVRMIVASFLCKNLRYHWLHGAQWFWDALVDADLASNSMGWQWSAGSGVDAAPYFRVFNPVTQGQRFDPNGDYVRKYCPELVNVPNKFVHNPWQLPGKELTALNLEKTAFANPIVDLKLSRQQALDAWRGIRN